MIQIVDSLSSDQVIDVRLAVYEGMHYLLSCSNAINATEVALKCLMKKKGINDGNDKVRLQAFKLLNALKRHRFIKVMFFL